MCVILKMRVEGQYTTLIRNSLISILNGYPVTDCFEKEARQSSKDDLLIITKLQTGYL